jgi:hypothetical protein
VIYHLDKPYIFCHDLNDKTIITLKQNTCNIYINEHLGTWYMFSPRNLETSIIKKV